MSESPEAAVPKPRVAWSKLPPARGRSWVLAEAWLSLRHFGAGRGWVAVSLVSLLSVLGTVLSVGSFNVTFAIMTGFELDLRDKILGANAHVVVLSNGVGINDYQAMTEKVRAVDGVVAAAPFIYSEAMVRHDEITTGIILKGLDPPTTGEVTHVRNDLRLGIGGDIATPEDRAALVRSLAGKFPVTGSEPKDELPGLVIGEELAGYLNVRPGDKVQLIDPLGGGIGPMGIPVPRVRSVVIAAVFDSGMYEYDTKWTYASNDVVQDFLGLGDSVTGIEVKVEDIDDAPSVAVALGEALGPTVYTKNWMEMNEQLFQALALERRVMGMLLAIFVFISTLLIVITITMLVMTKGREIAVLRALGATRWAILRIFTMDGAVIGLLGATLGSALGVAVCSVIDYLQIPLDTDVYYLDHVPVILEPTSVFFVALGAFVASVVAGTLPALWASFHDPVEGLRYE